MRLEFELTYYDVTVQHVNHYSTGNHSFIYIYIYICVCVCVCVCVCLSVCLCVNKDIIIIIIIKSLFMSFSHWSWLLVFHWSLSETKSFHVFRILPLISNSSSPYSNYNWCHYPHHVSQYFLFPIKVQDSQWIPFSTHLCRVLYSFCASLLHSFTLCD